MSLVHPEWLSPHKRPRQVLERLLERPDAAKLIRATPAQPLFLFIKSLGPEDAIELLRLCSTEQVQAFLDMDGWERDKLAPARIYTWVAALLELGPQKLAAHVRKLDAELLTTFLGPRLRVIELVDEEPPEESEGLFYATPDRFYMLDIVPRSEDGEAGDQAALLQRFIDALYRADLELARSIIQSARWDQGAETEEQAYRFRSGRMADLGYIDYYEALKVYLLLDPASARAEAEALGKERAETPVKPSPRDAVLGPWLGVAAELDECTFVRAAMHLGNDDQARITEELLLLCNHAMAADRVELGDMASTRAVLRRAAGYLSLGLEFRLLEAGPSKKTQEVQVNVADAASLLGELPLLYLFRLGYSLTLSPRKLATLLVGGQESGLTTLFPKEDPATLLPPRLAEPLRCLLLLRPIYSGYLDPTSKAVTHLSSVPSARPFLSLRDLGKAAAFLQELSTLGKFLTTGLGLRRDNLEEVLRDTTPSAREAQLSDLLGTMIANHLLSRPPVLVPIPRRDLPALQRAPFDAAQLRTMLKARVLERALNDAEAAELFGPGSQRLVDETLEALERSLRSLPEGLLPEAADAVTRLSGLVLS